MRQGEGSRDVALIECLNPMKGIWVHLQTTVFRRRF